MGKLIMNPNLAVYLLREGYTIIDLKANKNDSRRTVFVFREEDGLDDVMTKYTNMSKEEKRKLNKEE